MVNLEPLPVQLTTVHCLVISVMSYKYVYVILTNSVAAPTEIMTLYPVKLLPALY